jgi:MCP family monocarboxylic acid transporter-like MFS transporter 10
LVGSLAIGSTFFLSFFAGILSDKIGLRTTSVTGAIIATAGLGLSAVYHNRIEVLYVTYGLMFGTGASLAYNPSLTVLGLYFKKHLGMVNGFVTAGSSTFTIILSFINPYILNNHGVRVLFYYLIKYLIFSVASLPYFPDLSLISPNNLWADVLPT